MDQQPLRNILKAGASRIDAAMQADLASVESPLLKEILHHAIFQGGKRIRPLLVCSSATLLGRPSADLDTLAIAFEYLHAASLLHDDVIDHADLRRGKETANRRWGNATVILAGDYLLARAMELVAAAGGVECQRLVSEALRHMVEGEFLQMRVAETQDTSEAGYFAILQGKTAALIAAACEVGIIFAGGSMAQRQALRTYGANLGLAFQIIDDLLDYQGDPKETGKAVGNDFQEGKMTLPLLIACNTAGETGRARLRTLLAATPEARQEAFPEAQHLLIES
ncbi:MAG TPA: polyprenyl synthetase family protein, partial [Desulfurivibrionaceae bacterium]|nr:polyprenyl synthetase family protein [Desulfurivibrionaceae bacterium]